MSDKSHTSGHNVKKPGKSIKEKRAEKKAKQQASVRHDVVAEVKKR